MVKNRVFFANLDEHSANCLDQKSRNHPSCSLVGCSHKVDCCGRVQLGFLVLLIDSAVLDFLEHSTVLDFLELSAILDLPQGHFLEVELVRIFNGLHMNSSDEITQIDYRLLHI